MRYLHLCALLVLAFFACTPTVGSSPPPDFVTARFDPATTPPDVPAPTDLAKDPNTGLLAIPVAPSASAAEREFIEKFLNTLNGFPPDTPATANFDASLQPSSVNRGSVRVIDLTSHTALALTAAYADVGSPPKGQITIAPPAAPSPDQPNGWTIGHQYLVALIAGPNGLIGLQGQRVVGSSAWALLASTRPLVTCPDNLADPNCRATTDLIPSDETDPARRIADQAAKAKQLEQIRQGYAPLIKLLTDQGIDRGDIVLLWTFSILPRPQATFDPANSVIPFPNNLAAIPLPDGGVRVNLPIPDGGSPLVQQLFQGLNTLDGFSTTAPIVSENSDPLPALTKGVLDPLTIVDGGTGVLNLRLDGGIQPRIRPCLTDVPDGNCATFTTPDGGAPEQLQLIPTVPLLERTTYVAYFTTQLKDTQGNGVAPGTAFALMRNRYPLVDGSGNSTISTVPSQLAGVLEQARLVMKNGLDILESTGVTREQLVLATVFTTQSEGAVLKRLRGSVNDLPATPVEFPIYPPGCHTCLGRIAIQNLLTGPDGVFDPDHPRQEAISFTLFIPTGTPPAGGWPVTIFGHGLTRAQSDAFVAAFVFNQERQAVIATDAPWHGDRTICTGSVAFINSGTNADPACPRMATTDDDACANPATQFCCEDSSCPLFETSAGRCVARNPASRLACDPGHITPPGMPPDIYCRNHAQGRCITNADMTMSCEGGYFKLDSTPTGGVACVSGQNLLNLTDLFTTRDNFRQQVIDLTQLARVIQAQGTGSLNEQLGANALNSTQIHYVGMSLGGILGTLYTSVAPEIQNVVLNVPGSDLPTILLTSPTFRPARDAFIATLAEQNPPILFGTPAFDDFVGVAKWILDPADPLNGAFGILNDPTVPATRKALIQYITDDQVVPNPTTEELIQAARQTLSTGRQVDVCRFDPPICDPEMYPNPINCPCPGGHDSQTCSIPPSTDPAANLPDYSRHGFMLNFSPPVFRDSRTTRAQTQAARYINNPAGLTCTP